MNLFDFIFGKKKKSLLTKADKKKTVKRLLGYARPHAFIIICAFALAVIGITCEHEIPVAVGDAIDCMTGVGEVNRTKLGLCLAVVPVLILVSAVFKWLISLFGNRIGASVTKKIRSECIRKIEKLPLSYLDSHPSGEILSKVIADTDRVSEVLLTGIVDFIESAVSIAVIIVIMLKISGAVAAVVVFLTPLSMLVASFIANSIFSLSKRASEKSAARTAVMDEAINGLDEIRSFSHREATRAEFTAVNEEYRKVAVNSVFFSSLINPVTRFVTSLINVCVALVAAFLCLKGGTAVTIGGFTALMAFARNYAKPFNDLSGVIAETESALAAASRVFELLDAPEEEPDTGRAELPAAQGLVEMKNVDFSYTDAPFMKNVSFAARPGQKIAIVGPTGCGKTTLINLLMRFYDVNNGAVTVDGADIRSVTRGSLRSQIGMVLQDTWLCDGTVRDNITMGRPDATDEEIQAAAKLAHSHSFISRLPDGYDTVLGNDGGRLSAGERQLLCITRIMLALPPVLILDEATSSIDTRTEMKIQDAFGELMKGRTSFIVAHRLNTVRNADLILVMKNGNITEQGTHEELMAQGGFYAELYNAGAPADTRKND